MTVDKALRALGSVRLAWAPTPEDVWRRQAALHVPGLHETAVAMVLDAFAEARDDGGARPLGVVIRGQAGTGKTHLLGHVRELVQDAGGYFFLVGMIDASDFWRTLVVQMLDNLSRPAPEHDTQLRMLLWRLATEAGTTRVQRRAIIGETPIDPDTLNTFVEGLFRAHPAVVRQSRRVARALVLYAAHDLALQDIGESFLLGAEEMTPGERSRWGIGQAVSLPQEIAADLSRLLALTGPTLLAVDQIDSLLASSTRVLGGGAEMTVDATLDDLAHGLMALRESMTRTVPVVSCIPGSWALIEDRAISTVPDRFRVCPPLKALPTPDIGRALLAKRLRPGYEGVGFRPPYPTWPVTDAALADAPNFTPRQLLKTVDGHIQGCLRRGVVAELTDLGQSGGGEPTSDAGSVPDGEFAALDERFAALVAGAAPDGVFDAATEDVVVPRLLAAGLDAWIRETGAEDGTYRRDALPGAKPALHARLRRTLDAATEDEEHWAFRAISASNAIAATNRVQKASTAAGLAGSVTGRRLFLLRNTDWPSGAKTRATVEAFEKAGGRTVPLTGDDVRVLDAVRALFEQNPDDLDRWLRARRPAHGLRLFQEVLGATASGVQDRPDSDPVVPAAGASDPGAVPAVPAPADDTVPATADELPSDQLPSDQLPSDQLPSDELPAAGVPRESVRGAGATEHAAGPSIPVGTVVGGGAEVRIPLEALRKHTAIFAGSGSGKTVLIRRLVEECALHGVSSIVLDPNNDLARLGTPWPAGTRQWAPGDEAKAAEYLDSTEVFVWTPRLNAGRPLSFRPLPDFAGVVDDADEFDQVVDAAVSSLLPRVMADGRTAKARHAQAVLRQALEYFARRSPGGPAEFVALLEDLPEDVSDLKNAVKIAADLAENLKASMATDPLFGGEGAPVDPGALLTPSPGYRARVSVVNFAGLQSDAQRQAFVNQLQMALFAWIKKNPAGERPLGGLFVMDEAQTFAPSGQNTACTQSTLALASQARKYGLGLVFATQAPKGLHNRIPGNAATQFFGLLNSPVQIEAAKEMARVKGGAVPDVGRMPTGQFYAAVEGAEFRKMQAPLCLSHHPKSPPTQEEVVALARGERR